MARPSSAVQRQIRNRCLSAFSFGPRCVLDSPPHCRRLPSYLPSKDSVRPKEFPLCAPHNGRFSLKDQQAILDLALEEGAPGFEYWEALSSSWQYALPCDTLLLRGMKDIFLLRHYRNKQCPFVGRYIALLEESLRALSQSEEVIDVDAPISAESNKKVSYFASSCR